MKTSITSPSYEGEQSVEDRFNINGHTSLHLASENGHKEMVDLLLQEGADIHALDHWPGTILHYIELLRMDMHPLQELCFVRAVTFTKLTNGVTYVCIGHFKMGIPVQLNYCYEMVQIHI